MSAIFQQLRLRFKSQLSLGLIVGLGIISCWLVWTFWGRAQLIAIGLGLMLAVLIIFAFPRYAAAAIACFITAAPTLMLPKPLNLGLVVVLGIVIIRKLYKQDITWRITPFFIWCSLFFVWHLTSILWCGNYDYMGVGIHISAVLIMLVFSEIVRTNRDYEIMIYAASVGIIISFVSVIYGMFELYSSGAATQLAGNSKSIEGVRLFGFWNNANSMAYSVMPFTAISLGMLFRHSLHRWQRILLIIATVAGFISILVSLARGALICTAFIVFILILRSKRRWFILAAIGVAFLLTTVLFPTKVFSRFTDIASGKIDASIGERTVFLLGGIDMIIDSFPLGFGAGGSYVYQMDYIEHRLWPIGLHNSHIAAIVETGFIGAIFLIGTFISLFFVSRQTPSVIKEPHAENVMRIILSSSLIAILMGMAFEDVIGFPAYWLFFTLLSVRPLVTDYREPTSHMIAKQL